ncbi:MAG: hypothetical protein HYS98_08240 [Deltaproteobacteria bacterium]|nr:hypothetical protein [Deltaproteobacteria bacterium]
MKKYFGLLLIVAVGFVVISCGKDEKKDESTTEAITVGATIKDDTVESSSTTGSAIGHNTDSKDFQEVDVKKPESESYTTVSDTSGSLLRECDIAFNEFYRVQELYHNKVRKLRREYNRSYGHQNHRHIINLRRKIVWAESQGKSLLSKMKRRHCTWHIEQALSNEFGQKISGIVVE